MTFVRRPQARAGAGALLSALAGGIALREVWRATFVARARGFFAADSERGAVRHRIAGKGRSEAPKTGHVSLVGAGPGSKDLITLRGAQHLSQADVVFYDRLLDPEILELARRDANRVYVGKAPGRHSWSQSEISAALVAEALAGKRVVRLKCGDPGVFARSTEEIDALNAVGIPFDIVPGVTAACAAAASLGQSLTDRGSVDTLVLTTGHRRDGYVVPEAIRDLKPGTCVALYMAVGAAPRIVDYLYAAHGDLPFDVQIIAKAQRDGEVAITCSLRDLPETLRRHKIGGEAMLFIRLPDTARTCETPNSTPGRVMEAVG